MKGRRLRLGLVFCHGAHTREKQEHADEKTQIIVFNVDIKGGQGKARQGRTYMDRIHRGVTSRPDQIKLNRQDYKYTGKS